MPAAPPGLRIRTVGHGEVDLILDWAAEEGWNPGRADAGMFWATDPDGFLLAEMDGDPVGAISAVRYGTDFGMIGLYLVRPSFRGHGIGHSLWLAAMARLSGRTIGVDAVPESEAEWAVWGFARAHGHVRHVAPASRLAGGPAIATRRARDLSDPRLQALDRACFPAPRAAFLRRWIGPPHRSLVAEEAGGPVGMGVVRPCREGHRVGPLVARDPAIAHGLLSALTEHLADAPVSLDVPDVNAAAMAVAADLGMEPQLVRSRMYLGDVPPLDLGRIYGVTTLELG